MVNDIESELELTCIAINLYADEKPTKDYTKCVERFASDDNLSAPSCAPVEPKRSATIKCDHCDQVFLTRQGISVQKLQFTSATTDIWNICIHQSSPQQGHMRHVHNSENKPPPGECVHCGMDFGDAETMVEHKRLHLNRPDFQCIQCDRVLTRKQTLKIHMRTHVRIIFQLTKTLVNSIKFWHFNIWIFLFFVRLVVVIALTNATNAVYDSHKRKAWMRT